MDPTPESTLAQPTHQPPPPRIRLTLGGCCPLATWSPDSAWVYFIDRPDESSPWGLYGVSLDGGEPVLLREQLGILSLSGSLLSFPEGDRIVIEQLATGERWKVDTQGRPATLSPSGERIAWDITSRSVAHLNLRQHTIWVAAIEGSHSQEVITTIGGGFLSWAESDEAILVAGRLAPDGVPGLWRVHLKDGAATLLLEVERVRGAARSPSGGWLAYYVAFADRVDQNGLWVVRTDGTDLRKIEPFGAYRWRSEGTFLLIPLDAGGESLWQVEAAGGEARQLTHPEETSLPIANNDWSVSPDGRWMLFLSKRDGNLWLLELPDG